MREGYNPRLDFISSISQARHSGQILAQDSVFYPIDQPWILRNLTTKEFVRADGIAIMSNHIHGPFIKNLGFGDVLLARTCWSTDDDTGLVDYNEEIHQGVWAGHCFDIVTVAHHNEKKKPGENWQDVSEEVSKEVRAIYISERSAL
ncbi:uncharacterized protein BDR25DRAFT_232891 [Lindgomyces ingoldianus]|uniref:Uncharacterized protein n=1 Tax=Lindgomyces ingoldianus TaxID=673940 RepID=A0ACB6QMP2_9PLEO|nr:uncharacterized protein BDR25DRAFT_232891 [Lindgomyces ingoldianus]KAF2468284.1 hypothetical protein BDR25DRAFT_232891 [Lindgomyces ingoldianus]